MRRWSSLALLLALAGCDRSPQEMAEVLPATGSAVPAFDFQQLDGTHVTPAALAGKPAVLALWSSSCPYSRRALAELSDIQNTFALRGVRVLIIADDADSATVQRVLDRAGVALPVALADGKITRVFAPGKQWPWQQGVSLPSFLILDADGRVTNRIVGIEVDVEPGHGTGRASLDRVRHALDLLVPPLQPERARHAGA